MHVLIVEDDARLAALLRKGLAATDIRADVAASGREGLERAQDEVYDAVILDLTLPDLDGIDVARRLRADGVTLPILMLTARAAVQERIRGLQAGADDYLPKPFAFEELRLRLRAITRRGPVVEPDRLVVGDLVLDRTAHAVSRAGRPISLAPRDYALLEYLMRHPGRVFTRSTLLDRVWDYGYDPLANVVDSAVRRLRRAVDDVAERPLLHTVRGVGYMIKAE